MKLTMSITLLKIVLLVGTLPTIYSAELSLSTPSTYLDEFIRQHTYNENKGAYFYAPGCSLEDTIFPTIAQKLAHGQFYKIFLADNSIGDAGLTSLIAVLPSLPQLKKLTLNKNIISCEGAKLLCAYLLNSDSSLNYVNICDNNIGQEGINAIMNVVQKISALQIAFDFKHVPTIFNAPIPANCMSQAIPNTLSEDNKKELTTIFAQHTKPENVITAIHALAAKPEWTELLSYPKTAGNIIKLMADDCQYTPEIAAIHLSRVGPIADWTKSGTLLAWVKHYIENKPNARKTIAHLLLNHHNSTMAQVIFHTGIRPDEASNLYSSPLHEACKDSKNAPFIELLLNHNATIDHATRTGKTPLHVACEENIEPVMELLLKRKANINAKTYKGYTPLSCTVQKGFASVVEKLLAAGADASSADANNYDPLTHTRLIQKAINLSQEAIKSATKNPHFESATTTQLDGLMSNITFSLSLNYQRIETMLKKHLKKETKIMSSSASQDVTNSEKTS